MKTKLSCLLALLIVSISSYAQQKIIGGSPIDITSRPYQAAIYVGGVFNGGGVIINDQWILTAAHVVNNLSGSTVTVSTGHTNLTSDNGRSAVSQIILHPNNYDIALVRLATPLVFSSTRQPITISQTTFYTSGTRATVSGWGRRSVTGSASLTQLYETNVTIKSRTLTEIEAAPSGNTAYRGDSGGPLTMQTLGGYILIGLVSHGNYDSPTTTPCFYTNVGNYYNWIASYAEQYSISAPELLCGTSTFTISAPGNCTLELSPNLTLVSQSGKSYSIRSNGNGRAFINIIAGNTIMAQKFFWSGAPIVSGITYDGSRLKAETFGLDAKILRADWTINGNSFMSMSEYLSSGYTGGPFTVTVRPTNNCGTGVTYTTEITLSTNRRYAAAVSVGSRDVIVKPIAEDSEGSLSSLKTLSTSPMEYTLINLNTARVGASGTLPETGGTLSFSHVPSGIYVLNLILGGGVKESFKIVLK